MASLAQLLTQHGRLLVLDAAATVVQTGLYRAEAPAVWRSRTGEAGQGLFMGTAACLEEAGLTVDEVAAFVFCEGPGSMLGIRTAAMALRTWQAIRPRPVYRYQSLDLLARELVRAGAPLPCTVIADARRGTWHGVTIEISGQPQPLRRIPAAALAGSTEPLWMPAAFRSWAPPPRAAQDCAYDLPRLLAEHGGADLLTATEAPEAFQHETPEYRKWTAQVHRAPC